MNKKIQIPIILGILAVGSASSLALTNNQASAVSTNPAISKKDTVKTNSADVLQAISEKLQDVMTSSIPFYKSTVLFTSLNTDFAEKDYPSKNKDNSEGIKEDGTIDIESLKKPITEPSQVDLAGFINMYNFYFNNDKTYKYVSSTSGTEDVKVQANQRLNYFDYITLINKVKDNPEYTAKQKQEAYTSIEADLQHSIDSLYGDTKGSVSSGGDLSAWGESKSANIPFSSDRFSYVQLLSAYKKDAKIKSTLAYYSTIMDTLTTIREYSISMRQGNSQAKIDRPALEKKLSESYKAVETNLLTPVNKRLDEIKKENSAKENGDTWQDDELNKDGLSDDN